MKSQSKVLNLFDDDVFVRPLFSAFDVALRFQLSTGGHFLQQFDDARTKGAAICDTLLGDNLRVVIVLFVGDESLFSIRRELRTLRDLEFDLDRSIHWRDDDRVFIEMPMKRPLIPRVMWCAAASDFATIQPRVHGKFYMFDLDNSVCVFPYDDRGMDVVGDRLALKRAFDVHHSWLLPHNLAEMNAVFSDAE